MLRHCSKYMKCTVFLMQSSKHQNKEADFYSRKGVKFYSLPLRSKIFTP